MCSKDDAPEGLKYWTCPHDYKICGESQRKTTWVPDSSRMENVIKSDYKIPFNLGKICRYSIEFPEQAKKYDRIVLTLDHINNANVFIV